MAEVYLPRCAIIAGSASALLATQAAGPPIELPDPEPREAKPKSESLKRMLRAAKRRK